MWNWGGEWGDLHTKKGKKRKALGIIWVKQLLFSYVGWKLRSKKTDAWVGYIVEGRD